MSAEQLIDFVSLRDDERRVRARYCPKLGILVIKHRRTEYRWHLSETGATKSKSPTRQTAKKVLNLAD